MGPGHIYCSSPVMHLSICQGSEFITLTDEFIIVVLFIKATIVSQLLQVLPWCMLLFWLVCILTVCALCLTAQVSSGTLVPECLRLFMSGCKTSTHPQSKDLVPIATPPRTCGHLGCYFGPSATLGLGHMKWEHIVEMLVIWVFPNVIFAEMISCGINSNVCNIVTDHRSVVRCSSAGLAQRPN